MIDLDLSKLNFAEFLQLWDEVDKRITQLAADRRAELLIRSRSLTHWPGSAERRTQRHIVKRVSSTEVQTVSSGAYLGASLNG